MAAEAEPSWEAASLSELLDTPWCDDPAAWMVTADQGLEAILPELDLMEQGDSDDSLRRWLEDDSIKVTP